MCLSISLEVSCAYKLYYSFRKEKDLFGQELVQGLNLRMLLTPPHIKRLCFTSVINTQYIGRMNNALIFKCLLRIKLKPEWHKLMR